MFEKRLMYSTGKLCKEGQSEGSGGENRFDESGYRYE